MTRDDLLKYAKDSGVRLSSPLAMSVANDPFACGQPHHVAKAEWCRGLWDRLGLSTGVHLRRIHYLLVSDPDATRPNGEPYQNTETCWGELCSAGKYARTLGLVDPLAFEDRRNPEPLVNGNPGEPDTPWVWIPEIDLWTLPSISPALGVPTTALPTPEPWGYDHDPARDEPVLAEVWAEKSTQHDILVPACRRLGVNLVTGLGFLSISAVARFVERVRQANRPARILYISDFDPAGDAMPVAIARQIEFERWRSGDDSLDIVLQPLVLTVEQVESYALPRVPIKESDLRRGRFEALHGAGAVELDALEALHPGELARLLNEAVAPYRDPELAERLNKADDEAREVIADAWQEQVLDPLTPELRRIRAATEAIVASYRPRLKAMAEELDAALEPLRERLEAVNDTAAYLISAFEVRLPERPVSDLELPEEDEALYVSGRDYLDQLSHYQARKAAGGAR